LSFTPSSVRIGCFFYNYFSYNVLNVFKKKLYLIFILI
jgi:hypothetical protein